MRKVIEEGARVVFPELKRKRLKYRLGNECDTCRYAKTDIGDARLGFHFKTFSG